MLPIAIHSTTAAGLSGAGEGLARRQALLSEAGVTPVLIAPDIDRLPAGLRLLFVAGLPAAQEETLAAKARAQGVLVNVEDQPKLCDFHVPAVVRRGDLLISISTGGKAPGLAKLIREWIEHRLGLEWRGHVADIAEARARWRGNGLAAQEVSRKTRALVAERELLP